jgi:hypothetical protein
MTEEQSQEIIAALRSAGVNPRCERCDGTEFTIVDGHLLISIQRDVSASQVIFANAPIMPCAGVVCVRCGNVSLHSLGILGLIGKS